MFVGITMVSAKNICDSISCNRDLSEYEELSGDEDGWIALGRVMLYGGSGSGTMICQLYGPVSECELYAKEFLNGMVRYRVSINVKEGKRGCFGPEYEYFAVSASVCDNGRVIGIGYVDERYTCSKVQGNFYLYL